MKIETFTTRSRILKVWKSNHNFIIFIMWYSWFHGEMQRTAAEILLLSDEIHEGTFLLRRSLRYEGYAVSVRCEGSVKHFKLSYNYQSECFIFGNASFPTLRELLDHFESCPILSKDNGEWYFWKKNSLFLFFFVLCNVKNHQKFHSFFREKVKSRKYFF